MELWKFILGLLDATSGKRFAHAKLISDYMGILNRFVLLTALFIFMQVSPLYSNLQTQLPKWLSYALAWSPVVFMVPLALTLIIIPLALLVAKIYGLGGWTISGSRKLKTLVLNIPRSFGEWTALLAYSIWLFAILSLVLSAFYAGLLRESS